MKNLTLLTLALISLSGAAQSATKSLFQCATDETRDGGVRINMRVSETGELRANLIFGTTVSGTMYQIVETSPGRFEGTIRSRPGFRMVLEVTKTDVTNTCIQGKNAKLSVTYPDVNSHTGVSAYNTKKNENFVCGKKIAKF